MATVAVGDIHGNVQALADLLAKLVPTLHSDDALVFLGDYIDRGPDTRGCLERIVRLKDEIPCPVVGLLGNHEVWMLRTLGDPKCHSWLIATEALETIASYSAEAARIIWQEFQQAGRSLLTGKALPYEVFFDLLPAAHRAFLESLKPCYQSDDVLCVHGGTAVDGNPLHVQPVEVFTWEPKVFPTCIEVWSPLFMGIAIMRFWMRMAGLTRAFWKTTLMVSTRFPMAC